MAKLIILITTQLDKGLAVAEAWEAAGAPGVTIIESHGLHNLRERSKSLEIPFFVSMTQVLRQIEETNQTLMCLVNDDAAVDTMIAAAETVLGDMDEPNSGIAFVLDVARTFGLRRLNSQNTGAAGESG